MGSSMGHGGGTQRRHLEDDWVDQTALDDAVETPSLVCPGCGNELGEDESFRSHRVCGGCRRHFPLRARERLALIVDDGSFRALPLEMDSVTGAAPPSGAPPIQLDQAQVKDQARTALGAAVVAGTARIGGSEAVLVVLDGALLGPALGAVVVETVIRAFELALARSLPVVVVCAGGAARTRSGPLALVQSARLAATASRLHLAAVPMIAVLTHPTAASVFGTLAAQCDVIFAEPGTHVGAELGAATAVASAPPAGDRLLGVESLMARGAIDGIVDRVKLRGCLGALVDLLSRRGRSSVVERIAAARAPRRLTPSAWEALGAAHHAERPDAAFYLHHMVDEFIELRGDRIDADASCVVGGFGRLGGVTVAVVALREDEVVGNAAATVRKAARIARLAGHWEVPLVLFSRSPVSGATASVTPELSHAIAQLLGLLVVLPVPIVAVAVGAVRDPLAAALMTGDRVLIQDHAVYAVGAMDAGIGRRLGAIGQAGEIGVATSPVLTARECLRLGLVDAVVPEPEPAAHADPAWAALTLGSEVRTMLGELCGLGARRLLDLRQRRLRHLGQSTPEGVAAARSELHELHEWQRSLRRSLGELRERWERREHRTITRPHVALQRPELSEIAQRLATLRAEASRARPRRTAMTRGGRAKERDAERTESTEGAT